MRLNDLNGGSIKTLLILVLLVANLVAALPNKSGRSQSPGSARTPRAALAASPSARTASDVREEERFSAKAPKTGREARALPGPLPL
jgi:hypothetical protein